eukprot:g239.t1
MGAGASVDSSKEEEETKKGKEADGVRKEVLAKRGSKFDFSCKVKSDLDNSLTFLADVARFLSDSSDEVKDTPELRQMLVKGCSRVRQTLNTFRKDQVFTVLERHTEQDRLHARMIGSDSDFGDNDKEKGEDVKRNRRKSQQHLRDMIHAYSDIRPDLHEIVHNNFSITPHTSIKKSLKQNASRVMMARRMSKQIQKRRSKRFSGLDSITEQRLGALAGRVSKADWNLDIFHVNDACGGFVLPFLGIQIFRVTNILNQYKISIPVLEEFLETIHLGYKKSNPYHNATHGADVMYTMHCFFKHSSRLQNLTMPDMLAALLAACVHDYKHDGRNNTFHKITSSNLAMRYNDRSPLENMHASEAFNVLQSDTCNILKNLTKEDYLNVRKNMIRMILATDMASHFNHVADFRSKLKAEHHSGEQMIPHNMALDMALHAADISNAVKCTKLYKRWANAVMEEFFQQGDDEKSRGMSPVAMFDRDAADMKKSQHGFIDFIVKPTFELWGEFLFELRDTFDRNLEMNRALDWGDWKASAKGQWGSEAKV